MATEMCSEQIVPNEDPRDCEDFVPPKYSTEGRILFQVEGAATEDPEITVIDWDDNSAVFWLNEGIGIDYFLKHIVKVEFDQDGFYLLQNVYGEYYRGDGWETDDDEEWYYGNIIRVDPDFRLDSTSR